MGHDGANVRSWNGISQQELKLRKGKSCVRQQLWKDHVVSFEKIGDNETSFYDLIIAPFLLAILCSGCFLLLCIYLPELQDTFLMTAEASEEKFNGRNA
jgi:hypothetical protein